MQECEIQLVKNNFLPLFLPFFRESAHLKYATGIVEIFGENGTKVVSCKPTEFKNIEYIWLHNVIAFWDNSGQHRAIAFKSRESALKFVDFLEANKCQLFVIR